MNFFLATDIGEEISEKVSENSTEKSFRAFKVI